MTPREFDRVSVGDELPPLTLPITVQLIAGGAIATRDYFPGHHDAQAARELGSPHIFMNILTTNGLVQRYVENWAGPDCRLADLKIKLGAPNYPGDTMTFTGSVTDKRADDRSVLVTLKGSNSMGPHVSGTVRVRLP
ncbi:MAG TPA: MaoC family dehydratase [Burkholderiaceae bacterium]|nr:MaoC family dehydratase [Burkholderiaceae bacterium]HMZ00794.1 MaoC family dehydratase [Burkholderiaceae bacterium]HNB46684.1 MaoC family dehydratase [Burkholderiaceae bacterium]HNG78627.1 MaoC family dehydratase [Burkholderiaceae bacterium]